jgi:hypothetical protein
MPARRAFSFAEVMFAVAILGVGFIMIAAIFPVATEQTRNTADEAVAAALARSAVTTIQKMTDSSDFVAANMTATFNNVWAKVSSSAIDASDPRYAWVPFFSKFGNGPYRLSVLIVRRQIHGNYLPADTQTTLLPKGVTLSGGGIVRLSDGTYRVDIERDPAGNFQCVAPGTFLIIGQGDTNASGAVVRVGEYLSESDTFVSYRLQPGQSLSDSEYCYAGTTASIIGREFIDSNHPELGCDGSTQDVSVYTTFLPAN